MINLVWNYIEKELVGRSSTLGVEETVRIIHRSDGEKQSGFSGEKEAAAKASLLGVGNVVAAGCIPVLLSFLPTLCLLCFCFSQCLPEAVRRTFGWSSPVIVISHSGDGAALCPGLGGALEPPKESCPTRAKLPLEQLQPWPGYHIPPVSPRAETNLDLCKDIMCQSFDAVHLSSILTGGQEEMCAFLMPLRQRASPRD